MELQRSSLYNIAPIGIKTIEVESLSGYISRLAYVHCITVGELMNHLIAPNINKKYINNIVFKGGNGFYKSSSAINSHGVIAHDFIKVIAFLTCREDIGNTTFGNCRDLVPFRGLLKNIKYWCPSCYQTDLENSGVIYERLSWTLQPIHKCLIHDRSLENVCPYCKSFMYILERKSLPGFCSRCHHWLGNFKDSNQISVDNRLYNQFIKKFFLELICTSFEKNNVPYSLLFYIENHFEGSLTKAVDFFDYPKSTFWMWKEGKSSPPLHVLIDITMKLQLDLTDFLNMRKPKVSFADHYINKVCRAKRVSKEHNEIEKFLNVIVKEKRPYSLSEIAKRLKCDRRLLAQRYPNECRYIKINYLEKMEIKKQNKDKLFKEKIDNALYTLEQEGIYPSSRKIEEIIGNGKLHEKKFQDYWRENKGSDLNT
ncbi:TniQ family protein [Halalkalibacter oceani]|uniref:TniQ family protein n=1 Tax=Halalkalibacter oceani TaxID=1653776 RepID=UPI003392D454